MPFDKTLPRVPSSADAFPAWQAALWGFLLSALAGFVNLHAFMRFQTPVSHLSGAAMHMGDEVGHGRFGADLAHMALVLLAFFLGAVVSGAIVGQRVLVPGRRYGVVLMVEGAVLLLSALLAQYDIRQSAIVSAVACGLQNAMAASYYGMVLRTTHITGMVTDLGMVFGHLVRGHKVPWWKVGVLLSLTTGFVAGGIAYGVGEHFTPDRRFDPLWLMGGAVMLVGLGYYLRRVWLRRRMGLPAMAAPPTDE